MPEVDPATAEAVARVLAHLIAGGAVPVGADGHIMRRTTADGRLIALVPLTYGRVRVTASDPGDTWGWRDGY